MYVDHLLLVWQITTTLATKKDTILLLFIYRRHRTEMYFIGTKSRCLQSYQSFFLYFPIVRDVPFALALTVALGIFKIAAIASLTLLTISSHVLWFYFSYIYFHNKYCNLPMYFRIILPFRLFNNIIDS